MSASQRVSTADDPNPEPSRSTLTAQAGVLLVAAGLFALISRCVATSEAQPFDQEARSVVKGHRTPALDVAVKPVTVLSLPLLVASSTAVLAWWLREKQRPAAALAVGLTPLIAAAAGQSFTTFLAQRNPPDADRAPEGEVTEPSFPSGHTTGVTAEALLIAYVLWRERLIPRPALAAFGAWPLLVGATRLYRDRHWASDILGGLAAGTAVAAMTSMLYEWQLGRVGGGPTV